MHASPQPNPMHTIVVIITIIIVVLVDGWASSWSLEQIASSIYMSINNQKANICLTKLISQLLSYQGKRETIRTHVELKFICPLTNETITRVGGVCCLVLEDIIPPRGIPIFIKHHWGASTTWETRKGQIRKNSFHFLTDDIRS